VNHPTIYNDSRGLRARDERTMARPSYLCRREGGRYYLQIRVGKPQAELYGRPVLRASLRTSDFGEGRRRLMDGLGCPLSATRRHRAAHSITSSARPSNDSVTSCDPATPFGLIEEPLNSLDLGICA
jgi:hypothetical protein